MEKDGCVREISGVLFLGQPLPYAANDNQHEI